MLMSRNLKYQMFSSIDNSFTPNVSKHALKHDLNYEGSRIFSFRTRENLRDTASDFSKFIKQNFPEVKYIRDVKEEHVNAFLESKKDTCSEKTLQQYQTRLEKIGKCCADNFGVKTNFHGKVPVKTGQNDKVRTIAMERGDFEKVLATGKKCESLTAIKVCGAFGLRVSEVLHIKPKDIKRDTLFIERSKGGRDRTLEIRTQEQRDSLKELKQFAKENDVARNENILNVKSNSVNKFLGTILKKLDITKYNDHKTGVHSIRKMYATERYFDLRTKENLNHKTAWNIVSSELGHGKNREDLFKIYVVQE